MVIAITASRGELANSLSAARRIESLRCSSNLVRAAASISALKAVPSVISGQIFSVHSSRDSSSRMHALHTAGKYSFQPEHYQRGDRRMSVIRKHVERGQLHILRFNVGE